MVSGTAKRTTKRKHTHKMLWVFVFVLYGLTRLTALDSLPLHNDEGLHLTRAVEVWNLHPFWEIRDGKIINHWAIAVFYPQNAPVFIGRFPTVLIGMIGVAAGIAVLYRLFGQTAAAFGALLWIASPYLFFYERMAFSDAEAGAWAILALWLALRLAHRSTIPRAILTGAALGVAALFKFTAIPYILCVLLLVLNGRAPLRQRFRDLIIIGGVVAVLFSIPIGYLLLRGGDVFSIALNWVGSDGSTQIGVNFERLWAQLTGFGTLIWTAAVLGGLLLLLIMRSERGAFMLIVIGVPLMTMILWGKDVQSRHYVVMLPGLFLLGGAGIGLGLDRWLRSLTARRIVGISAVALLLIGLIPFAQTAYTNPQALTLPPLMQMQYLTDHPAGFGLREAVEAFPTTTDDDTPIIGSLFGDSCRRANFYAVDGRRMDCPDAPGVPEIEAALDAHGSVYVLVESESIIGADVRQIENADAVEIARYPRPGETFETASVVLWRLDRLELLN